MPVNGQVKHLWTIYDNNEIFCNLVMAKSRVANLKFVTVTQLELIAATLAVRVAANLRQKFDLKIDEEIFWTDSRMAK